MLTWRRHRRFVALAGASLAALQALFLILSVELHDHGTVNEFTSYVISRLPSYLHHHHFAYSNQSSRTLSGGECIGCRIEHSPRTPSAGSLPNPHIVPPVLFAATPTEPPALASPVLPYRFRAPPGV